jgi:hypothetical protein
MRKIVDFVIGMSIEAGSFKTVFDYLAKGGSGIRGFDEWLTLALTQLDNFAGGKMGGFGELQLPTSDRLQTPFLDSLPVLVVPAD